MKRFSLMQLFLMATTVLGPMGWGASVMAQPNNANNAAIMQSSQQTNSSTQAASQQRSANSVKYECANNAGELLTIAHTSRGPIELIEWHSLAFGEQWNPARRCKTVTERFQTFSDSKQLRYVSTGRLNNYNVICVSGQTGNCIQQGLLITLERQDNPDQVLLDLFNYKSKIRRGDPKAVIDFNRLLQQRPTMPGVSTSPDPQSAAPEETTGGALAVPSILIGE